MLCYLDEVRHYVVTLVRYLTMLYYLGEVPHYVVLADVPVLLILGLAVTGEELSHYITSL